MQLSLGCFFDERFFKGFFGNFFFDWLETVFETIVFSDCAKAVAVVKTHKQIAAMIKFFIIYQYFAKRRAASMISEIFGANSTGASRYSNAFSAMIAEISP